MTKELIEKIEDAYRRVRKIGPDAIYETELREVLRAAADALESRQPSDDDREATEAEIDKAARALHMAKCCSLSGDSPHDFPEASEVFAAGVVLNAVPRAAVPDAANRELTEAIRLTVEYVGNDMLPAIEGWDWYDALVKYAPEVAQAFVDKPIHFPKSAERDAALAAIERVRAEADAYAEQPDVMEPCGAVAQALRTALDGAPEAETLELFPGTNAALDRLTVRKAAPAEAFCIEHGNFHAVELGDPTCELEDGFGEPVGGEKP